MQVRPVLWLTLVGLLLVPTPARAGFWDIIWEMTGPQMIGFRLIELERGLIRREGAAPTSGRISPLFVGPFALRDGNRIGEHHWLWLVAESYAYQSTSRKSDELNLGTVWMLGLDPMLAFGRYMNNNKTRLHAATGFSFNQLFGTDIHPLPNYAIKVRPIGVDHRFENGWSLGIAYNLRIYPNGFEVGANPPSLTKGSKSERVQGFVIELSF
jgi:hypothetical protein